MSEWISVKSRVPVIHDNCWRTSLPYPVDVEGFGLCYAYFCTNSDGYTYWTHSLTLGRDDGGRPDSAGAREEILGVKSWYEISNPNAKD